MGKKQDLRMLGKLVFLSIFSGLLGMKCYTGSCGEHGLPCPPSLESKTCNVNSCAKVSGKVDGITVGGWSCGAPQSQSSGRVSGVAPGITFDIGGDALKEAQTCFCGSDLCNTADFTGTTTSTPITTDSSTSSTAAPPQSSQQFS